MEPPASPTGAAPSATDTGTATTEQEATLTQTPATTFEDTYEVLWTSDETFTAMSRSAYLSGEHIVITGQDFSFRVLDADTGETLWGEEASCYGEHWGYRVCLDGEPSGRRVRLLDPQTGEQAGSLDTAALGQLVWVIATNDQGILVGGGSENATPGEPVTVAFYTGPGPLAWTATMPMYSGYLMPYVQVAGKLVSGYDQHTTVLDLATGQVEEYDDPAMTWAPATGEERYAYEEPEVWVLDDAVVLGATADAQFGPVHFLPTPHPLVSFYGSRPDNLALGRSADGIVAIGPDGATVWTAPVLAAADPAGSTVLGTWDEAGTVVVVDQDTGEMAALSLADGATQWQVSLTDLLPGGFANSVEYLDGQTVAVDTGNTETTGMGHYAYLAFNAADGSLQWALTDAVDGEWSWSFFGEASSCDSLGSVADPIILCWDVSEQGNPARVVPRA
ncbi:MAG: PQQ-binding-like beta-propeller repeat protein [Bifidobacteriaceae bacterium]|nr:PQQ-binding-like beta-propeller repeat protein [Bifidobacteriaceae bacterium]